MLNKDDIKLLFKRNYADPFDDLNLLPLIALKEVLEEEANDGLVPLTEKAEGYCKCRQDIIKKINNLLKTLNYQE